MINDLYFALLSFLDKGGIVLFAILVLTFLLSLLLIERFVYYSFSAKDVQKKSAIALRERADLYHHVLLQSKAKDTLFKNFSIIKVSIALLPLFGLLGTVTGMIEVFDVMASFGNSNPRLMASGVAKAIIPTMSGMAIAVVALLSFYIIKAQANKHLQRTIKELNEVYNASF